MATHGESSVPSPRPCSESDAPPRKFACIFLDDVGARLSSWYAFDVSDAADDQHNQTPPPPPLPLRSYKHDPPFHEHDDDGGYGEAILKPIVTEDGGAGFDWAILGSNNTLYLIRDEFRAREWGNPVQHIDLGGGGGCGEKSEWKRLPQRTPNRVNTPYAHTVVLGGKLYCLGGFILADEEKEWWGLRVEEATAWAMAYNPTLDEWECLPDPPRRPLNHTRGVFSAVMDFPRPRGPCIVLGLPEDSSLQIYRVDSKLWEEHKFDIPDGICGPGGDFTVKAVAAADKFYWYSVYSQSLIGYDLHTKLWFVGGLPMHDHRHHLDKEAQPFCPRLAHLGGDKFCLFWASSFLPAAAAKVLSLCRRHCQASDYVTRLHCMKFRISPGYLCRGIVPLEVSIHSCQSYLVSGVQNFIDALVVDGHLDSSHEVLAISGAEKMRTLSLADWTRNSDCC